MRTSPLDLCAIRSRYAAELDAVRRRVGHAVFERVAGADARSKRERIHHTPGPRWFEADSPIQRVHGDTAMFVGGLRALLLQSLHPLAMAAVAAHSGYRGDPWGRLQRTSTFLATTTFGAAADAERAVERVRRVHATVRGRAPDGRVYRGDDPHLLGWVHVAEVDSFLNSHQRYSRNPLSDAECDDYLAQTARIATALGAAHPPRSRTQLAEQLADYRPELHGGRQTRDATWFLLINPPLPLVARAPYGILAAAAVASLPTWARRPLRLPRLPIVESTAVPLLGRELVGALRWAMESEES